MNPMASDPTVRVAPDVKLGKNVRLAPFSNLYGCEIGDESRIGPFVEIQKGVRIGRRVKIQSHSFVCEGVHIEDEAFVGHGVMFTNDRFPRATRDDGQLKGDGDWVCEATHIGRRASIGSNATILCGVRVGAIADRDYMLECAERREIGLKSFHRRTADERRLVQGGAKDFEQLLSQDSVLGDQVEERNFSAHPGSARSAPDCRQPPPAAARPQ
jgi:UDP-2-acetamido-3-amino-2,3-dideoxy-glucuronate N-acetyltransferase